MPIYNAQLLKAFKNDLGLETNITERYIRTIFM